MTRERSWGAQLSDTSWSMSERILTTHENVIARLRALARRGTIRIHNTTTREELIQVLSVGPLKREDRYVLVPSLPSTAAASEILDYVEDLRAENWGNLLLGAGLHTIEGYADLVRWLKENGLIYPGLYRGI